MQPNQPTELDRAFIISGENKITIAAYDPNQRKFLDDSIFADIEDGKSFILIDTDENGGQRKIGGMEVGHYTALNFKKNDQGELVAYYTDSIGVNIPDFIKTELEAKGIDVIELKCPRQAEQDCFHHSLFNSLYIKENQSTTIHEIPENAQINYLDNKKCNFNQFKEYVNGLVDGLDFNRDITINVDTNQDITPNAESYNNPNESKQGFRNYLIVGGVAASAVVLALYSAYSNNGDNPTPGTDLIARESGLMKLLPSSLTALISTATGLTGVVAQALEQVQNGLRKDDPVACGPGYANSNCPVEATPVVNDSATNATTSTSAAAPTTTPPPPPAPAPASASEAASAAESTTPTPPPTTTPPPSPAPAAASSAASEAASAAEPTTPTPPPTTTPPPSPAPAAAASSAASTSSAAAAPTAEPTTTPPPSPAPATAASSAASTSSAANDYAPATTPTGPNDGGIPPWAIPTAVVGSVVLFAACAGVIYCCRKSSQEDTRQRVTATTEPGVQTDLLFGSAFGNSSPPIPVGFLQKPKAVATNENLKKGVLK